MAKEAPPANPSAPTKLPRLPSGQKIQKRPLLHTPIASSRTSSSTSKVIYVSASTPFISTVKRVRAYLAEIEKRSAGALTLNGGEKKLLRSIEMGVNSRQGGERGGGEGKGNGKRDEEVLIKGTGKAIEKVVRMAAWWGEQSDVVVRVRTGSTGAVDDIVDEEGGEGKSRLRRVSCLEVGVRLR